jgi:hypothetical protein
MEQQAQAVKEGEAEADIKDPNEVIEEMDSEFTGGAEFNADSDEESSDGS